jgi:hypothetical protein
MRKDFLKRWGTIAYVAIAALMSRMVLIISATVVPGTGWYLGFGDLFVVLSFLGCFMGAVFTLLLGNASASRKDRSE